MDSLTLTLSLQVPEMSLSAHRDYEKNYSRKIAFQFSKHNLKKHLGWTHSKLKNTPKEASLYRCGPDFVKDGSSSNSHQNVLLSDDGRFEFHTFHVSVVDVTKIQVFLTASHCMFLRTR